MKFLSPFIPVIAEIKYGTRTKSNQKKAAAKLQEAAKEIIYLFVGGLLLFIIFGIGSFFPN